MAWLLTMMMMMLREGPWWDGISNICRNGTTIWAYHQWCVFIMSPNRKRATRQIIFIANHVVLVSPSAKVGILHDPCHLIMCVLVVFVLHIMTVMLLGVLDSSVFILVKHKSLIWPEPEMRSDMNELPISGLSYFMYTYTFNICSLASKNRRDPDL